MHVFNRPKPSPLSKTHAAVTLVEAAPGSRGSASPPLTSSLNSRGSAASAEESAYLRRASRLRWARLAFAVLLIAISATVMGISSHLLQSYNASVMPGDWYLYLWPDDVDVRPTVAILVSAAIAVVGSLCYMGFALIPTPRSRFLTQNYLFTTLTTGTAIASLVAVIVSFRIEHDVREDGGDSISSWTCALYNGARTFASESSDLEMPVFADSLVPIGFRTLCIETMVARWMLVGLLVVQVGGMAIAALGVAADNRIGRIRRAQFIEKSSFT